MGKVVTRYESKNGVLFESEWEAELSDLLGDLSGAMFTVAFPKEKMSADEWFGLYDNLGIQRERLSACYMVARGLLDRDIDVAKAIYEILNNALEATESQNG